MSSEDLVTQMINQVKLIDQQHRRKVVQQKLEDVQKLQTQYQEQVAMWTREKDEQQVSFYNQGLTALNRTETMHLATLAEIPATMQTQDNLITHLIHLMKLLEKHRPQETLQGWFENYRSRQASLHQQVENWTLVGDKQMVSLYQKHIAEEKQKAAKYMAMLTEE